MLKLSLNLRDQQDNQYAFYKTQKDSIIITIPKHAWIITVDLALIKFTKLFPLYMPFYANDKAKLLLSPVLIGIIHKPLLALALEC